MTEFEHHFQYRPYVYYMLEGPTCEQHSVRCHNFVSMLSAPTWVNVLRVFPLPRYLNDTEANFTTVYPFSLLVAGTARRGSSLWESEGIMYVWYGVETCRPLGMGTFSVVSGIAASTHAGRYLNSTISLPDARGSA